jgi:hypothetical protein
MAKSTAEVATTLTPEHDSDVDREMERRYPWIPWRTPVTVIAGGLTRLGCRFCIARYGLKAVDVKELPETAAQFDVHKRCKHAWLNNPTS